MRKIRISEIVGIGAIIFNDLYNGRIKDVVFSWDKILNFEGETGPYVQYTYVRTCSLLKKAGEFDKKNLDYKVLTDEFSFKLVKLIGLFREKILDAAEKFEPYIISRHVMNIAQAFNKFYNNNLILDEAEKIKNARLNLCLCVNLSLKFGLKILGIKVSDVM